MVKATFGGRDNAQMHKEFCETIISTIMFKICDDLYLIF